MLLLMFVTGSTVLLLLLLSIQESHSFSTISRRSAAHLTFSSSPRLFYSTRGEDGGNTSNNNPKNDPRRKRSKSTSGDTGSQQKASSNQINQKHESAAAQARRAEEQRRAERAQDVVIGQTSAKRGAKDFALDPVATEAEWLRMAAPVDRKVHQLTELGMNLLRSLRLEEADEAFSNVFSLKPDAYLWQAGIVQYYLGNLQGAGNRFGQSANRFEAKFGEPATEERIWRCACELRLQYHPVHKRNRIKHEKNMQILQNLLPINDVGTAENEVAPERRKVFRIARDLFAARVANDPIYTLLYQCKLQILADGDDSSSSSSGSGRPVQLDHKMWRLHSWFYLGLFYDALGEVEESKACMKAALRLCPSYGNGSDLIHTLPTLHMVRRDWFDDDYFIAEEDNVVDGDNHGHGASDAKEDKRSNNEVDSSSSNMGLHQMESGGGHPVVSQRFREGLGQVKLIELKRAASARGLYKTYSLYKNATRSELEDCIYDSLSRMDLLDL